MVQVARAVASQIIPIADEKVVFPNTVVAEIVSHAPVDTVTDAPLWMLGMIAWRGLSIPLLSLEGLLGNPVKVPDILNRIAIVNAVTPNTSLPYYAFIAHGLPQLARLTANNVSRIDENGTDNKLIAAHVLINNDVVMLLDLDALEASIREGLNLR